MEEELQFNTKLFSFDGVIGRHGYFLNVIIISSIALCFLLPYHCWFLNNMQTFTDMFNLGAMFAKAPLFLKLWFLSGTLATFVLYASNVWRRLNDINGKVNKVLNISVIALFFLSNMILILPFNLMFIIYLVSMIATLIILFKRGKITGNYPYDYTKEFNWGAFIGTWIWGLVNKSYKTLWILLLGFTPWGPYYQLYCGLKGNEWAFKNKNWNDVDAFNEAQEKQTTIFAILFCAILPILSFILITVVISAFMFNMASEIKDNPQKADQTMEKLADTLDKIGSVYFESHTITPDENKYYVLSSDWNNYSFKEKKNIFDMAASMASSEREEEYKKQNPDKIEIFTTHDELKRTKIYSSETNKLLGEYQIDDQVLDKGSFKDIVKAEMKAYKFYQDK